LEVVYGLSSLGKIDSVALFFSAHKHIFQFAVQRSDEDSKPHILEICWNLFVARPVVPSLTV
jgi:hypothetical protein